MAGEKILVVDDSPTQLSLMVKALDGCGFDVATVLEASESEGSLGLLGMRERISSVGGTLTIESTPGKSTTLVARIPSVAESGPGALS